MEVMLWGGLVRARGSKRRAGRHGPETSLLNCCSARDQRQEAPCPVAPAHILPKGVAVEAIVRVCTRRRRLSQVFSGLTASTLLWLVVSTAAAQQEPAPPVTADPPAAEPDAPDAAAPAAAAPADVKPAA